MAETFQRQIRGVELFERRAGSGPPVVVLHGGPGAHHDYLLPAFDELARGRELIYYDQRGGGRSPVPRNVPVGWREQVEDLEALREIWGLDRLDLAGYSWGGLLAELYAVRYPARVASLALVSPAPAWSEARHQFEQRFAQRNLAAPLQEERARLRQSGLRERDPDAYRRRLFELSVAGYFHQPARASDLTPFRITGRTQEEVWSSLGDFDLRPALGRLQVRALVMIGDSDPIPAASAREVADLLQAPFHLLPHCGHVPYVEAHDEWLRLMNGFLPSQPS